MVLDFAGLPKVDCVERRKRVERDTKGERKEENLIGGWGKSGRVRGIRGARKGKVGRRRLRLLA